MCRLRNSSAGKGLARETSLAKAQRRLKRKREREKSLAALGAIKDFQRKYISSRTNYTTRCTNSCLAKIDYFFICPSVSFYFAQKKQIIATTTSANSTNNKQLFFFTLKFVLLPTQIRIFQMLFLSNSLR